MIKSITLLFIIIVVIMNSTVLLDLEAKAGDQKQKPKEAETCHYFACPFGIAGCKQGAYCDKTCINSKNKKLSCGGLHHQETNELWWWCPACTMDICGCEDPCPIGMSGISCLIRGL